MSDEQGTPIPYVNTHVKNTTRGVAANGDGDYVLHLEPGDYHLVFSALGYQSKEVELSLRSRETKVLNITLSTAATSLGEFEVVANRRDRAREIMRKVRNRRSFYLDRVESFECSSYLKTSLEHQRTGPVNPKDSLDPSELEIIGRDSSLDTVHKRMLTHLYEVSSTYYFQAPNRFKERIHAFEEHKMRDKNPSFGRHITVESDYDFESYGSDNIAPMTYAAENVYLLYPDNSAVDFNFYRNAIDFPAVTQKPMLSPVAATSALSYVYDYEGHFTQDGRKIHKLRVQPILKSESLFEGSLYIEDSTWALRKVDLEVNPQALVFCESFRIAQEYREVDTSVYLPASRSIDYTIKDVGYHIFGSTRVRFSNYRVNEGFGQGFFANEIKTFDPEAFERDSIFWMDERPELLNASEVRFIDKSDSIELYYVSDAYYRKVDSAFNRIDIWTPLVGLGHRNRAAGTEWYIEGLPGQINPLGVGGYRHQLPIHFKKEFENSMQLETDLRPDYGFYNEDFKLKAGIGFTYVPKRFVRTYVEAGNFYERINPYSSFEQIFSRTNFVNAVTLSIAQRMEVVNGLFAELTCAFSDQRPITSVRISPWERLLFETLTERLPFERYIKSEVRLDAQYRFRQKYFIKGNEKIIVGSDFPELFATWRKGIPDLFNSEVNFDYVEAGVRDETRLARYGTSNWRVMGGTFLNRASLRILEYKYLRGSDVFFFSDPTRSLQLLGPTFSTPHPFAQANYIHHFEGTLLNKMPLLNKLRLELAAGGGGLFVSEADFAQVELFAGLERVVRIEKQLFRFGLYAVTADNSVSTADYTFKFGINFFNTFTNKWDY